MEKKRCRKMVFFLTYIKNQDKIKYLLFKRKKHWKGWEFGKGGVEKGENLKKTVIRELKEETGQKPIKINSYNKSGKYKYTKKLLDKPDFNRAEYKLFSVEIKSKKIKIDPKEHFSYKFVNYEQALKMLSWPNQRACLRLVNSKLK